jgi:putative tricarboxylic transport membrane protein
MKVSDVVSGAIFMALAVFIFAYARTLPPMPGQQYGASAFPTVIAAGLFGFSLILAGRAWSTQRAGTTWVALAPWARDQRTLANFFLALALIALYVSTSERIGFIGLSIFILLVMFRRQRVAWRQAALIAVGTTIAIQFAFANLLRVPLPRGLLNELLP